MPKTNTTTIKVPKDVSDWINDYKGPRVSEGISAEIKAAIKLALEHRIPAAAVARKLVETYPGQGTASTWENRIGRIKAGTL